MKVKVQKISSEQLADPLSTHWKRLPVENLSLVPAPLAMVKDLSPFLALSETHGKVREIQVQMTRNDEELSVRLSWMDKTKNDAIVDLNEFSDGAAIMFPLTPDANAITMGDENNPVNAWFWKADKKEAFDVIAHGFSTSQRRSGKNMGLSVSASYDNERWNVVFQRRLRPRLITAKQVNFSPNKKMSLAVAVWDGGNEERAGQKSLLPAWKSFEIVD